MSPVAEADAPETVLQTPEAADVWVSRRDDLRLVKKARQRRYNASGESVEELAGECLRFRDGRLVVPHKGTIKAEDGRPVKVEEVRKFLAEHHLNGDVEEGFFPLPSVTPTPSGAEIEKLLNLVAGGDADGLHRFIEQEEAGYARETLLGSARAALERFQPGDGK